MENKPLTASEAMERARCDIMSATAVPEPLKNPSDFNPLPKLATSKDGNPMTKMSILDEMKKKMEDRGIRAIDFSSIPKFEPIFAPWWQVPVHLEEAAKRPATFMTEGLMAQMYTETDGLKVNKPKVYLHFI